VSAVEINALTAGDDGSRTETIWVLVPAETTDRYAAGFSGNKFSSQEAALRAAETLVALGGEFAIEWDAIEVKP
jgi:hypothetical protein